MRWPLVAKVGLALAVLTVVVAIVAAFAAAFVVDRDDDDPEIEQSALVALAGDPSG